MSSIAAVFPAVVSTLTWLYLASAQRTHASSKPDVCSVPVHAPISCGSGEFTVSDSASSVSRKACLASMAVNCGGVWGVGWRGLG